MTSSKRALAALAVGALALPILSTPAFADGEDTPPPPRSVAAFCAGVEDAGFTDVDEDNAFHDEINCIAEAEITRGLGGNLYGPTLQVSRGQMASFIARMLDTANRLDTAENVEALPAFDGTNAFVDVPPGDEHREAINRLAAADIVLGGPGGLPSNVYGSTLRVSRAQMASFVIRSLEFALDSELNTTDDYFTDDANAAPHQANINTIASLAIAIGDGNNTYNPTGATSRGQMAAFIARSLAYLESRELIRPLVVAQAEVSVTNQGDVAAGQAITGAITGPGVASATVSGPCVTAGTLTDTDTTAGGIQFSIPTSDEAAPGQCAVAFTVSFSDGRPTQTTTVNVAIVAAADEIPATVTAAAPLVGATSVVFTANEALAADSVTAADFTGTATITDVSVSADGLTITVTTEALTEGQTVILGQNTITDLAGNLSPAAPVTATAVAPPVVTVAFLSPVGEVTTADETFSIEGVADEVNTAVVVFDASGENVGEAVTDATGAFSVTVTLTPDQPNSFFLRFYLGEAGTESASVAVPVITQSTPQQ